MSRNFNDEIAKTKAHLAELKRKQKTKEREERKTKRKEDDRRNAIIGKYVTAQFPQLLHYKPQRNNAETDVEFKEFTMFLSKLADKHQVLLDELLAELRAELSAAGTQAHLQVDSFYINQGRENVQL
jgi:hypothetical protein